LLAIWFAGVVDLAIPSVVCRQSVVDEEIGSAIRQLTGRSCGATLIVQRRIDGVLDRASTFGARAEQMDRVRSNTGLGAIHVEAR